MRIVGLLIFLSVLPILAQDAISFLAEGDEAGKQSKWHDAEIAYRKAVEADPKSAEAHSKLADAIALQAFPTGVATASTNAQALRLILSERQKAAELAPQNIKTLQNLAQAEEALFHFSPDKDEQAVNREKALADERKLIDLAQDNVPMRFSLARMDLWYADHAIAPTVRGSSADPESPRISEDSVRRRFAQEAGPAIDEAITQLKKILERQAFNQAARANLSYAYWLRAGLEETDLAASRDLELGTQALFQGTNVFGPSTPVAVATNPNARFIVESAPPPPPPPPKPQVPYGPQRIGGNVMEANLLKKVQPEYPPVAKAARVQGTVEFTATINKEGHVSDLQLVRGHPLLVNAAKEAVLQWEYRPTMLNGRSVEVITDIIISFNLMQ